MAIFYTGYRKAAFDDVIFGRVFGFLYKRYELEYFWWHTVIVLHKGMIVIVKVFMFDLFLQAPAALLVTSAMIIAQTYTFPFESELLDKLQTGLQWTEFVIIALGIMFGTRPGQGELQDLIIALFYFFFFMAMIAVAACVYRDVRRYSAKTWLQNISKKYNMNLLTHEHTLFTLYKWARRATGAEFEMFRYMQTQIRPKYKLRPAQRAPYLYLAKRTPELTVWLCWSHHHHRPQLATLGNVVSRFMDEAVQTNLRTCGSAVEEDLDYTNLKDVMQFSYRDIKERREILSVRKHNGQEEEEQEGDLVSGVYKQLAWGTILYLLCHCSEDERQVFVACCRSILGLDYEMPSVITWITDGMLEEEAVSPEEGAIMGWNTESYRAYLQDGLPGIQMTHSDPCSTPRESHVDPADHPSDSSNGPLLDSEQVGEDRITVVAEVAQTLFARYDFDESGLINSYEELRQLSYAVLFAVKDKGFDAVGVSTLQVAVDDFANQSDSKLHTGLSVAEFTTWFNEQFMGGQTDQKAACPHHQTVRRGFMQPSNRDSGYTVEEAVSTLFGRYDFDGSGTISTYEELRQLSYAVLFALKGKGVDVPAMPVVNTALEAAQKDDISQGLCVAEVVTWLNEKIMCGQQTGRTVTVPTEEAFC